MVSILRSAAIAFGAAALLGGCSDIGSYGVQSGTSAEVSARRQHYSADNPSISFTNTSRTTPSSGDSYTPERPTALASSEPVPERLSVTAAPEMYGGRGGGIGPVSSGYYSGVSGSGGYSSTDTGSSYSNAGGGYSSSGGYVYSGSVTEYDSGGYVHNNYDGFVVIIPPKDDQESRRRDWSDDNRSDDRDVRHREARSGGGADRSSPARIPLWQRGDTKGLGGVSGSIHENVRNNLPGAPNFVTPNTKIPSYRPPANSSGGPGRGTGR